MSWVATVDLVQIECWWRTGNSTERCGRIFGVTQNTYRWMREEGGTVHCPAGHKICFGPTELTEAREALERERRNHSETQAKLNALTTTTRKLKRRIAAGVCPCCHRTFVNMGRHMKSQHPTYGPPKK